jgi:hypothetical protein
LVLADFWLAGCIQFPQDKEEWEASPGWEQSVEFWREQFRDILLPALSQALAARSISKP